MQEKAYKIYVTDSLRIIGENTAKFAGGGYLKSRWADVVDSRPKEARTGEEIVAEVIKKSGLKLITSA